MPRNQQPSAGSKAVEYDLLLRQAPPPASIASPERRPCREADRLDAAAGLTTA